jgi:hypothetical protein
MICTRRNKRTLDLSSENKFKESQRNRRNSSKDDPRGSLRIEKGRSHDLRNYENNSGFFRNNIKFNSFFFTYTP